MRARHRWHCGRSPCRASLAVGVRRDRRAASSSTFPAAAAGPADAHPGQPFRSRPTADGDVVLTEATLHVGAVYLDQSAPVSGATEHRLHPDRAPTSRRRQRDLRRARLDVDLLSPSLQPFPAAGSGTTIPPALVGQVWLTGGDINTVSDPSPPTAILVVAGTAVSGATTIPFTGRITIGSNRQTSGSAAAGGDSICKERIVSPIATSRRRRDAPEASSCGSTRGSSS